MHSSRLPKLKLPEHPYDKALTVASNFKSSAIKVVRMSSMAFPAKDPVTVKFLEKINDAKTRDDFKSIEATITAKPVIKVTEEFKNSYNRLLESQKEFTEQAKELELIKVQLNTVEAEKKAEAKRAQADLAKAQEQITKAQEQIAKAAEQAKELELVKEKLNALEAEKQAAELKAQQQIASLMTEITTQTREKSEFETLIRDLKAKLNDKTDKHDKLADSLADLTKDKKQEGEKHRDEKSEMVQKINSLENVVKAQTLELDSLKRSFNTLVQELDRARASIPPASSTSSDALTIASSAIALKADPGTPLNSRPATIPASAIFATPAMPPVPRPPVATASRSGAESKTDFTKVFTQRFSVACNEALAHIAKFISSSEISAEIKRDLQNFRCDFLRSYLDTDSPESLSTGGIINNLLTKKFSNLNSALLKFPREALESDDKEERISKLSIFKEQKKAYYFIYQAYSTQYLAGNLSLSIANQFLQLGEKATFVFVGAKATASTSTQRAAPATTVIPSVLFATAQRPSLHAGQQRLQTLVPGSVSINVSRPAAR